MAFYHLIKFLWIMCQQTVSYSHTQQTQREIMIELDLGPWDWTEHLTAFL